MLKTNIHEKCDLCFGLDIGSSWPRSQRQTYASRLYSWPCTYASFGIDFVFFCV